MEQYKLMLKVLRETEPKLAAAKGLINLKGAKEEAAELLSKMELNLSDMAMCLDNFICSMATQYNFLMDINTKIFEMNRKFFLTHFSSLSELLDSMEIVKGGEVNV